MGTCVSKTPEMPLNVFKARNIDEGGRASGGGYLEVTDVNLIFRTQSASGIRQHEWPLKWLRKYGCDGDIFSFEAGHKCPGGEGIYAFSTKFASRVFELVQENISQGQPSNRTSSTNGTAEKYVKGPSRHQSASSGSTRRSPPAEFSGSLPSNRSQTLPASSAVSGSSLTSDSEVQQERQAVSKPSQATPQPQTAPTGGTSAETTPVQGPSKEAQKIEEPKFGYAKLDLAPSSDEKPVIASKLEKTNYAQLRVGDSQSTLPPPTGNGTAVAGPTTEYVNYTPGQGVPPEERQEAPAVVQGGATYTNLDYCNGTLTVAPPPAPQISYAQLDFSKSPEHEGKVGAGGTLKPHSPGAEGSSGSRLHSSSISSAAGGGGVLAKGGKEQTNYAQLDYNAMETVTKLPTREKVQRH